MLVRSAVRELMTKTSVTSLLHSSTNYTSYIFAWKLWEQVDGTGSSALVLTQHPWEPKGMFHTRKHTRLQVQIFSDVTRGTDKNPTAQDAQDKAYAVYLAVDAIFHRPGGGTIYFDDLRVHATESLGEPDISDIPMMDYGVRGLVSYGVMHD